MLLNGFTHFLMVKDPELSDRVHPLMVMPIDEDFGVSSLAEEGTDYTTEDWNTLLAYWKEFRNTTST